MEVITTLLSILQVPIIGLQKAKTMSPLISIIIPIYNVEQYLRQCVVSVVNQTYKNIEIILVDDGSQDNCPAICDEYARHDDRIKVIHKENGGLSDARNAGLDIASGSYIGFVDSDDWLDEEMYHILVRDILDYKADIACCEIITVSEEGAIIKGQTTFKHKTVVKEGDDVVRYIYGKFSACNKLYRSELFGNIRFPFGKLYEDARTTYRLAAKADRATLNNRASYYHRIRLGSIMQTHSIECALEKISTWDEIGPFIVDILPDLKDEICSKRNRSIFESARTFARMRDINAVNILKRLIVPGYYPFRPTIRDKFDWMLLQRLTALFIDFLYVIELVKRRNAQR